MSMRCVEVTADIGTWRIEALVSFPPKAPLHYSVTSMKARPYHEDGTLADDPQGFEALRSMDDADMRAFEAVIDKAVWREFVAGMGPDEGWHQRADAWRAAREGR
ncbi:MAG: hypothetical protein HY795_06150 [Desulfovibrio sp.]|nr:hypothetical protein [Desulfovibrio sp.]MBI4961320.1 hypothetical protein [Desulfovibrio sp.]